MNRHDEEEDMITTGTVRSGGIEIAYTESGSGEPVILLHGGESGRSQYDVFSPLLGEGIRAIAYDQRDTGDSRNTGDPYTMADLAHDCATLIRGLGLERAHVFGSSYGGALALQVGISEPDVVQTLVIGATMLDFAAGIASNVASTISKQTEEERNRMMLNGLLSEAGQHNPELVAECRAVLIQRTEEQHTRRMSAVFSFDATDQVGGIRAPTLLFHGEDDPIVGVDQGRLIVGSIPGARLEVLPGLRHGLTLEGKNLTAALLRDFVLAHPLDTAAR